MGKRITSPGKPGGMQIGKPETVVFGFKHLQDVSFSDCKSPDFLIAFIQRLRALSNLTWQTIYTTGRHSFGSETIPVSSLKPSMPLSNDLKTLLVLRATGDNHPFLGFRNGNTFEIVFIEANFGDIYDHGSK